jgi:hypothetical protein
MHYFKDFMPERAALEAAKNNVNIIMGNYDRLNVPGMFTNFGIVGNLARPFQTLHNTYMGKMVTQIIQFASGVKGLTDAGVPKERAIALMKPLAVALGGYYLFSGLSGMPGAQEWNTIARFANSVGMEMPLWQEMLRRTGTNRTSIYGVLGEAIDVNVGATFNAPAISEIGGMPSMQGAAAVYQIFKGLTQTVAGNGSDVDWAKVYQALRTLMPPQMAGIEEHIIANKQQRGERPAVTPNSTSFKGTVVRNERNDILAMTTGRRSVTEADERDKNMLAKFRNANDLKQREQQIEKLVNNYFGIGVQSKSFKELFDETTHMGIGADPSTTQAEVISKIKDRLMTDKERVFNDLMNSKGALKQRKLEVLRSIGFDLPKDIE